MGLNECYTQRERNRYLPCHRRNRNIGRVTSRATDGVISVVFINNSTHRGYIVTLEQTYGIPLLPESLAPDLSTLTDSQVQRRGKSDLGGRIRVSSVTGCSSTKMRSCTGTSMWKRSDPDNQEGLGRRQLKRVR